MSKYLLCIVILLVGHIPVSLAMQTTSLAAASTRDVTGSPRSDGDVAAKLTALTSLAVSPILVGGGRSALLYWRASPAERKLLPWTASPWYWGALLFIGVSFFLAHVAGTSTPFIGKFVDAARSIEGKASLIYASPLFLAAGTELLGSMDRAGVSISPFSNAVAASTVFSGSPANAYFGGLLGLAIFGVIWLSNQAFHSVVLLSPSMLLASAMRLLHLLALGVLLLTAVVSPIFGAILAAVVIFICARLAGWSFRLSVVGTVFAWDLLTFRRREPARDAVLAFSSPSLPVAPRTMGRLVSREGKLTFVYRPCLIGPLRTQDIGGTGRLLMHGVFYSNLVDAESGEKVAMMAFPPRYRGSEDELARFANCAAVPSALKGGLDAAAAWLRRA